MTVKTQDNPSGTNPSDNPRGVEPDASSISGETNKTDKVAWETYQKSVTQEKNLRDRNKILSERLETYESNEKQREEKQLQEQGDYQKLLAQRTKEKEDFEQKYNDAQTNLNDSVKLTTFLEKLPGKMKRTEYMSFIPLDSILMDPATGEVDQSSVADTVTKFAQDFPDLIQTSSGKKLPDDGARPTSTTSYDEWLKLPPAEKRKAMAKVRANRYAKT